MVKFMPWLLEEPITAITSKRGRNLDGALGSDIQYSYMPIGIFLK